MGSSRAPAVLERNQTRARDVPSDEQPGARFRAAEPDDALCVGVFAMQVFLDTYATDGLRADLAREALSNYSPDAFRRRLEHSATRFILAERTQHLIGFAELVVGAPCPEPTLRGGAELVRLYVHSRFRRMGLGSDLLARAEACAARHSATNLWLTAWTGNAPALAFYASRGYERVGSTRYAFEGRAYTNHIYRRELASSAARGSGLG